MTGSLFCKWVKNLDREVHTKEYNIALILDNCLAHPIVEDIKLVFLPPNTSKTQPLDSGIIKNLKYFY